LKKYSDELLTPTYLYSSAVLAVKAKVRIKAIANITGGAFYDKIPRIIPDGMSVDIDKGSWPVPWIFSLVKERARADDRTMYRTFNMGIGMVLVIRPEDVHPAQAILKSHGFKSYLIGEAVKGEGKVNLYG
jgi:phosphoribosylformylglycinamidine cyclo-ligase